MKNFGYKTFTKFHSFSPKNSGFPKNLHLNNIYNIGNFADYYRIAKYGSNNDNLSNIFLYYSPKNININNARIRNVYSPLRKGLSLKKSSSQNSLNFNRPMSHNQNGDNSLYSISYAKSPKYGRKKMHYNLEKEKLYQETYQIRKMVNYLNRKLSEIKLENLKRDNQINRRQKKINDIIINNNESTILDNSCNKDDISQNINFRKNYNINIFNDNSSFLNDFSVNSSINFNNNINYDDVPIYSNFNLHTSKKSGTYHLLKKIKKSINQINTEITLEKRKYEEIKKSLFLTKLNELNIETTLLEEQINKINTFIQKDILIQEENQKKKDNYINLQLAIERQDAIIKSLNERSNYLDKEEEKLRTQLEDTKKKLESKAKKISVNKEKLNILIQKNNSLSKNKEINKQQNKDKLPNNNPMKNPKDIKTYYTGEISKLNKIIKFYTTQCEFSEKEIARLKDQQIKAEGVNRKTIKPIKSYLEGNLIKPKTESLTDNEKINNIKKSLNEANEEKNYLKKKLDLYQNKLQEIEKQNEEDDFYNKSQIEFGIDENNPFCIDDNNNEPEKSGKFTSAQFNQFTYILFKNFEAKGISYPEAKDNVIKLFLEFNQKNGINNKEEEMNYKSEKFNNITKEYSKIILDVLNRYNNYNFKVTEIFIKALFYNSEYDVNKLIEYFKVLFSYTRNHSLEEEKYINKLKNKYKNLVEKLISSIKKYLSKEGTKNKKYIHLLTVKNILEKDEINFKDKYIEFIFYYMKKFDDPESKLEDLKLSLLYDLIQSTEYNEFENTDMNINPMEENDFNNDINIDINKNEKKEKNKINKNITKKESKKESKKETKENNKQNTDNKDNDNDNNKEDDLDNINNINDLIKEELKKEITKEKNIEEEDIKEEFKEDIKDKHNSKDKLEEEKEDKKIELFSKELANPEPKAVKKSATEDNMTPKMQNMPSEFNNRREKNIDIDKENTDDMEEDEDSMTEITNEEYVKQLREAIKQMKEGLEKAKTNFNDLMNNVVQKRKINGRFYEYVTIEDFNEQLKTVKITLTDLKLSCLCSKYCIPNELRLVDKNKIDKDIQNYAKGILKLEEEENI